MHFFFSTHGDYGWSRVLKGGSEAEGETNDRVWFSPGKGLPVQNNKTPGATQSKKTGLPCGLQPGG